MKGTSETKNKMRAVKLALVGVGVAASAITALGLRQLDVSQLDPHPHFGL